jgi:hypothetical protein
MSCAVLLNTAPHDKAVCESLAIATTRYRNAFVPIARRLMNLGALREELAKSYTRLESLARLGLINEIKAVAAAKN